MTERQWRNLETGLRDYADETAGREPSAEVFRVLEASLTARERRGWKVVAPVWRWAAAAVILVLMGAGLDRWSRTPEPVESPVAIRVNPQGDIAEALSGRESGQGWAAPVRSGGLSRVRRDEAAVETYTPWYIDRSLPQARFGQVTRVRVTAASAASFGVLTARGEGVVVADVFVGEDGLARAIRFVR